MAPPELIESLPARIFSICVPALRIMIKCNKAIENFYADKTIFILPHGIKKLVIRRQVANY